MAFDTCEVYGDCDWAKLSLEQKLNHLIIDDGTGCPTLKTSATLTSGSGDDFELRSSTYKANTAGTGYSIGDFIKRVDIINVTTEVIGIALWFNETTGLALAGAPTQAHLDPWTEPVSIADGCIVSLGAKADAAATTDAGTFSLIALFKRLLEKLTAGINVGGFSKNITPTITTTSTPYSIGDCVGGVFTLTGAARNVSITTLLQSIHVKDASNQKQPFTILIFNANPTGATTTDNAAFAYGADFSKQIGIINVVATDYTTIDGKASAPLSGLGRVYTPNGSKDLFAVIIAQGTPTYGANSTSLMVTYGLLQD